MKMNLKFWRIIDSGLIHNRKVLATMCLMTGILSSGCAISHTKEIQPNSEAHSTPLPNGNTQMSIDPSDRAFLLDWCEDFASSKGMKGFRKRQFKSNETAIRICIGVNTPRDTILLIEKLDNDIQATLIPSSQNIRSKTFKAPINLKLMNNQDIWDWIEDSGMLSLESSKADCLSDPAYDSVVIVLEIRKGESYVSEVASEGCCSIEGERSTVPRLVAELGGKLNLNLFKCDAR